MIKKIFNTNLATQTRIRFVFAFLLLLAGNILFFISVQKIQKQSNLVQQANRLIDNLENISSKSNLTGSLFRNYVIDQSTENLGSFRAGILEVKQAAEKVAVISENLPVQKTKVAPVNNQIQEYISLMDGISGDIENKEKVIDNFKNDIAEEGLLRKNLEKTIVDIQTDEIALWEVQAQKLSEYIDFIKILSIISTIVAVLLTLYSIFVYNKENKAKKEADRQADLFRTKLEQRVSQLADMNSELIELKSLEKFTATGRIARTMAHEVRNPLTNINLAVEQLKTEFEGTETADIFLDMINRNSDRINALISNLLNATKLTEPKRTNQSINDLLRECLKEAGDRIKLNHINIVTDFDNDICDISVDADKIKIAFLNLIVNGVEAMEDGGTLAVSTSREKNDCIIKISDTGKGMSPEQMNRLFEPFFTTKQSGNGLGLANTHNIIISHNGSIKCESEAGKGTTFTVILDMLLENR